jgi:hypothetical protein
LRQRADLHVSGQRRKLCRAFAVIKLHATLRCPARSRTLRTRRGSACSPCRTGSSQSSDGTPACCTRSWRAASMCCSTKRAPNSTERQAHTARRLVRTETARATELDHQPGTHGNRLSRASRP